MGYIAFALVFASSLLANVRTADGREFLTSLLSSLLQLAFAVPIMLGLTAGLFALLMGLTTLKTSDARGPIRLFLGGQEQKHKSMSVSSDDAHAPTPPDAWAQPAVIEEESGRIHDDISVSVETLEEGDRDRDDSSLVLGGYWARPDQLDHMPGQVNRVPEPVDVESL